MKKILALCAVVVVAVVALAVWRLTRPEQFGRAFTGAPAAALAGIKASPGSYTNGTIAVSGKIVRQCPASGCWFYVEDEAGNQLKVDAGLTIPSLPKRVGRMVTAEGRLVQAGDEYEVAAESVRFGK